MSEVHLWEELDALMTPLEWHASRVESHTTSAGIPDVDYCYCGDGHIELKYGQIDGKMPRIRDTQVRWMMKRAKAGGKVLMLTKLVSPTETVYLWHAGSFAMALYGNPRFEFWFNNRINDKHWELNLDETKLLLRGERQ